MLNACAHVNLRQAALQWALESAALEEAPESILARADAYLQWVLYPVRDDVVRAMSERERATIN